MLLYDLGPAPWARSQLIYHALAHLGRPALVLVSPDRPYVSTGYFQDPDQELDLEYCRREQVPVFRRQVGGGLVYLDANQIFWQLVLPRDHPLLPVSRAAFYRRFLEPVIRVYQRLGVPARLLPINDLAVNGRKICGTGAGEIGECVVFVGNLMRSFDCGAMARVAAAPDADFRRRFQEGMEENLTSLRRELGPEREQGLEDAHLRALLAQEFADLLGPLRPAAPDLELEVEVERLATRMLDPAWINFSRKPRPTRKLKIKAGLFLCHCSLKSGAGSLSALYALEEGRFRGVRLGGDGLAPGSPLAQGLAAGLEGRAQEELAPALAELLAGRDPQGQAPGRSQLEALLGG